MGNCHRHTDARSVCTERPLSGETAGSRRANLEGTAADSVCFILILFMASSQGQLVNEVERAAHLLALRVLAVPVLLIHLADVIHMILNNTPCGVNSAYCSISSAFGMDSV